MTASPATPSDHGLRTAFPATLLIALAALAAVAPLATDAYLPAFAQMADDLGVSASSVQLTMTTFLVGIALGQLGIGVLSDRVGRRPQSGDRSPGQSRTGKGDRYWRHCAERSGHAVHRVTHGRTDASVGTLRTLRA